MSSQYNHGYAGGYHMGSNGWSPNGTERRYIFIEYLPTIYQFEQRKQNGNYHGIFLTSGFDFFLQIKASQEDQSSVCRGISFGNLFDVSHLNISFK